MRYLLTLSLFSLIFVSACNKCKDVNCNTGECDKGTCTCPTGFSGTNCEIENKCVTNNVVCQNEGECVDGVCDCAAYYHGASCEDRCVNGTYNSDDGSCGCKKGYEDATCETVSRVKFLGTYDFESNCNTIPAVSVISEHSDADSVHLVSITNLSAYGDTKGYGEISGNQITIPKQNVKGTTGDTYSVESIEPTTLTGGVITLKIRRKLGSFSVDCTHTLTIQ